MSRVVVVIGTGSIGMRHLAALGRVDGVRPVAVPIRPARAAELERDGYEVAPSMEEALALEPFAAVVATDTSLHLEHAARLLDAGCHLLIEKPIGPTAAGVAGLAAVAERQDRRVFVACCLRFDASLRKFRSELAAAGSLHHVRIECQSFLPEWRPGTDYRRGYSARADEGGVLRDLVHEIDYASWLYGRPEEVTGMLTNGHALGIEADAGADLAWRVASGASISIRLDYLTRTSRRRMTAFGDLGEIQWDAIRGDVAVQRAGSANRLEHVSPDRDAMMLRQAEAFVRAASGESEEDLATLDEGAFAIAVCDAARRASASGARAPVLPWRNS